MKKILLLTWFQNNNFGTLLQATSMLNILNSYNDVECKIMNYNPRPLKKVKTLKNYLKIDLYMMKIRQLYNNWYSKKYSKQLFEQTETFNEYIKKNIDLYPNKTISNKEELVALNDKFDIFLCGSDQIWNPDSLDVTYLLKWVASDKNKSSYGSSLSSTPIPEKYYELYKESLGGFKNISIRDKKVKKQLEDILNRKVKTVVDPVMLLGRNDLLKKCTENFKIENGYCFSYFLGIDTKLRKIFLDYCNRNNLKPISVVGVSKENLKKDIEILDYADWKTDPIKFLDYINNANCVITDSFHATLVAILFHKDFWVFEKDKNRPAQNNRILELLDSVELQDRWKTNSDNIENVSISEEKWSKVDEKIETMRKDSFEYLSKVIGE